MSEGGPGRQKTARWPWVVLGALLTLLTVSAATFDRSDWRAMMGDEATYLMQAASLAWDGDVDYSREDYDRFREHWTKRPQGLILQSGDGGGRVVFGKPFFYAAYIAPFTRLAPHRGPFVANALLLAFTCWLAARVLTRRLGPLAPLWVVLLVFGSVAFAQVFWAHPDLLLMCAAALAFALAFDRPAGSDGGFFRREAARWVAVGFLLAIVGFSRPPYLALFLPALLAVPRGTRKMAWPMIAAGAVLLLGIAVSTQQALSGSWTSYGAERLAFYRHTGFPEVDFPSSAWDEKIDELGNFAAAKPSRVRWSDRLDVSLWLWNGLYFLVGRHIGILPYFLPWVLGLGALVSRRRDDGEGPWVRWGLVVSAGLASAAILLWQPFNFYGGGGSIANRYFLPVFPALWFLPIRLPRLRWLLAAGLVSALFVGELWWTARSFPITREGRDYRYVTPVAERLLPYETTLSHLKLAGREDLYPGGIFLRPLEPRVRPGEEGWMVLPGQGEARFMVGSIAPLEAVRLELADATGISVESAGERLEPLADDPSGRAFLVPLPPVWARHPTWWSQWQAAHLYDLELRFDNPRQKDVTFRLSPPPPATG